MSGDARAQVQELYRHLDGTGVEADQRMAYYGQLRAQEHSHAGALEVAIEHFRLRDRDWYQRRMAS